MIRYTIRRAEMQDAEALPGIEQSAGEAFRQIPELAWLADGDNMPAERHRELIAHGTCWVAADLERRPIGFLSAEVFSDELHIWEFDVHLDHQQAGIGGALLRRAIEDARSQGLEAVTLTTFRDLRWNQVFYERIGFKILEDPHIGSRLSGALRLETEHGMPAERRCAMRLPLR